MQSLGAQQRYQGFVIGLYQEGVHTEQAHLEATRGPGDCQSLLFDLSVVALRWSERAGGTGYGPPRCLGRGPLVEHSAEAI